MATSHGLDKIFGYMPFDHFLVERWDPESSLHQDEQERDLVKSWISLGRCGRSVYFQRCMEVLDIPIPDHIPPTLSAFEKRKTADPEQWSAAGAIWIRTWYGNEASLGDTLAEETVSRTSADEAYLQLWQKALWPPDQHGFDNSMFGPFVFEENDAAYGVLARDADDEVELMDVIPSFILSALVRCPDAMEGSGHSKTIEDDDDLASRQALLVVVADREACEDGWALLIAINHKGQVLHRRVRCKASWVGEHVTSWKDGGEPLDVASEKENIINYLDGNRSGNGWDKDEAL
ncbi:hypothetical protein P153DRAFT_300886 [Dothidotthia symphoricarpi CBS 119687]|uniref:Uncharacterized protein n=1 Tax=Dothidotthia symphoricarpi CBS 119687 TaxID=1392245 RepID=A0A6A6A082_9PLEO|nr:uncharacterized protein P153DRAFT_300886 [Dothidotthia symphoricarpi CBS 119687]KAF2125239.1 hypothetical protein P153DRAFT_300886 [Dothidotthia symphoricarpi CBS 119687]